MNLKLLIAMCLLAATFVPSVSAHDCAAYDGCDASGCRDGEDHSHTDYNYWPMRDESCSSSKAPDPDSCDYFGHRFPPAVCRLLKDAALKHLK